MMDFQKWFQVVFIWSSRLRFSVLFFFFCGTNLFLFLAMFNFSNLNFGSSFYLNCDITYIYICVIKITKSKIWLHFCLCNCNATCIKLNLKQTLKLMFRKRWLIIANLFDSKRVDCNLLMYQQIFFFDFSIFTWSYEWASSAIFSPQRYCWKWVERFEV